ncbi:MAG: TldD/PmbA family protein [Alphaproteobacteria bacterium]
MTDSFARSDAAEMARRLVEEARKAGADAADAVAVEGTSLMANWRLGRLEDVERSEGQDVGLRVFVGQRQACVSSNDLKERGIPQLVERALAMARTVPEDPWAGLAPGDRLVRDIPQLDLDDEAELPTERLTEIAASAEDAALAVRGVTNSNGASAGWSRGSVFLVTSSGFTGAYSKSSHSVSCSVLAGSGTEMETDYDYTTARHLTDLRDAKEVGRLAGERSVRRLGSRRPPSGRVPVVFDRRVSRTLLGHFAGAISGSAIARGTSFLKEEMDKPVFADRVTIIDDPHRRRGLGSRPFDGEGVAMRRCKVVDGGRLTTWLLDSATARQLGLKTTGHAARGTGGPPQPSPSNFYMEPGEATPEALMADIESGFYVTDLIGMGVNAVTGDYSRGAGGFWIENGRIAHPVNEVTVAGNLKDMFRDLTPANDLEFRYGMDAPTVRVDGMTVAGA